jgi:hypothetical protein
MLPRVLAAQYAGVELLCAGVNSGAKAERAWAGPENENTDGSYPERPEQHYQSGGEVIGDGADPVDFVGMPRRLRRWSFITQNRRFGLEERCAQWVVSAPPTRGGEETPATRAS